MDKISLFFVLFFIVLGIGFLLGAWGMACNTQEKNENWVEVEGTIVGTDIQVRQESGYGGSTKYEANLSVIFEYEYGGKIYEGILWTEYIQKGTEDAARAVLMNKIEKSYKTGSTRTLYANPANPQEISHSISFAGSVGAGIAGLICIVLGLVICKFHLRKV